MCNDSRNSVLGAAVANWANARFGRLVFHAILALGFLVKMAWPAQGASPNWQPAKAALMTRWSAEVSPGNAHAEYPRPQMVRREWLNLNGLWELAFSPAHQATPADFPETILVPFPVESALSGLMRPLAQQDCLCYRRRFAVPAAWRGQRILLHFGAVNWQATVTVNGLIAGTHRGGYDPFTLDITELLQWNDQESLVVVVTNPLWGDQPRGKQSPTPGGIFYSRASGIWQTVWLEPVPAAHIKALRGSPDLDAGLLRLQVLTGLAATNAWIEAKALSDDKVVGVGRGAPGEPFEIRLQSLRPWQLSDPFLYDLEVTLHQGSQITDQVRSYFGMRKISMDRDERGQMRLMLNNSPVMQIGVLDQGYWPDGIYAAPTDEALRFDIESAKRMGFNLIRKHQKIEPDRWYYWCDRVGLIVWQDMPSAGNTDERTQRQFETELRRMMDFLYDHPCVVMWNLFNQGWGQYDSERITRSVKEMDHSRLVNCAGAWNSMMSGDVEYFGYVKSSLSGGSSSRVLIDGFGGWPLRVPAHAWTQAHEGNRAELSPAELADKYRAEMAGAWDRYRNNGISGTVFTQLTDVEGEYNGLLTYDRAESKVPGNVLNSLAHGGDFSITNLTLLPKN